MALVQIVSVRQENHTWDEAIEIASGYSFLKTGEFRMQPEHPPLGKILIALPLLAIQPGLPLSDESWANRNELLFGSMFLYDNRVPARTILFTARIMTIGVTIVLALAIALWTRRNFSARAAIVALALFCLDPNVIANGRYVKNDLLVTLLAFLTIVAWLGNRIWWTGVLFGLAVATKFSAIFLVPVLLAVQLVKRRSLVTLAAVLAVGAVLTLAVYGPENQALIPMTKSQRLAGPEVRLLRNVADRSTAAGRMIAWTGARLGWRAHPLFVGAAQFAAHTQRGHESYLLGMHSMTGWWYYFPVAFLVKTPLATLVSLALAALIAWREPKSAPWLLLIPVAIYGLLCLNSRINTGLRHLLPLYPFLFVFAGVCLARLRTVQLALLGITLAAETLSVHPHYLAFFNAAAGGPAAGPRYLADSNIDWGQDLHKLRTIWTPTESPKSAYPTLGQPIRRITVCGTASCLRKMRRVFRTTATLWRSVSHRWWEATFGTTHSHGFGNASPSRGWGTRSTCTT